MKRKKQKKKPQPSELAGGAGFTFEDAVGAFYLVALLGEAYAPGIENRTVHAVTLQQRSFGQPLDDVIVDFRSLSGEDARLSLQVKSTLTISAANTNTDFREIIGDCWKTYQDPRFRKQIDRYGVAVGSIARDKARGLTSLCEIARESGHLDHFRARFAKGGNASAAVKGIKRDTEILLASAKGKKPSAEEVHQFLAHFVLVEFDFLHAGASHTAEAMTRLRDCIASDQAGQAPIVWKALCRSVRESAGRSGQYHRTRLVRELSSTVHLRGAASLRGDLDALTNLAKVWVQDIQNDVGGTHLDRPALLRKLEEHIGKFRFIQISGLPGSGKSVLLRQRIDSDLKRGPVLVLKADRLEGKSWATFATANGLSNAPLPALLVEVAAVGSDTLYIDGIDRIEKDQRTIVLDVLRSILESQQLHNWKIVVTLRDTGIEPLRNWLASVLSALNIGTVEVGALDDDEARALAKAQPSLHPLLFGPSQVREIVRRPFFAKVLSQSYVGGGDGKIFEPNSEVDLIENWWARGGYNVAQQAALVRQRAIVDIAAIRAQQLAHPVAIRQLAGPTVSLVEELIADGILRYETKGHTVRFSHDIFFEWSFFHVLVDQGGKWPEAVRQCGEPPAVGRVVELLSQWEYARGNSWTANLKLIAAENMRPQWTRAWLMGPIGAPSFETKNAEFASAAMAGECSLLRKAMVWFQAEKTTPNANILASTLPSELRVRAADMLGWPSDFAAWRRLIAFLLVRLDSIPVSLYREMVSVFEVWQNALSGTPNPVSVALLRKCAEWLKEIDQRELRDRPPSKSRWDEFEGLGDFRQSLCRLILRSAASVPELAEEYLKRVIASERLRNDKFKEIMDFSATLASTHPQILAELTLKHLREELPNDQVAREREEMRRSAEHRKKLLEKPEAERTRKEQMFIDGAFSSVMGVHQFSHHDWQALAIDRDSHNFFPPSPLREPFHSLFALAPSHALGVVGSVCNHAITAWRQLHTLDYERRGTPIPLEIQFPWGTQQFWGGDREYLWHRGMWAPHGLESAFLAIEEWCLAELGRGRPVDELIRQILEGNQCIAILGTAAMLVLHTERVSETAFPIVMAQRLWFADFNRMVQDRSHASAALIGFRPGDEAHYKAVQAIQARPVRQKTLRWFAPNYVLSPEFGERARAAILAFKDNLPFEYEEHRKIPAAQAELMRRAEEYAELAQLENYIARKSPQNKDLIEVRHVSPSAAKPENVRKVETATRFLQQGNLWAWASKSFENGVLDDGIAIPAAVEVAKRLDDPTLFTPGNEEEKGTRRGAVAGTAAVVLQFRAGRPEEQILWAREVLARAVQMPESYEGFWSPQSVIPWHPSIFAARGLAADLRSGTAAPGAAVVLLSLVAHPLEIVALTALVEIATLAEKETKLVWAAFHLAFDLCRIEPTPRDKRPGPGDPIHSSERMREALLRAVEFYEKGAGWLPLPLPPTAWIRVEPTSAETEAGADIEFAEEDKEHSRDAWTAPPTHWYSQYAAKVLQRVPVKSLLASSASMEFMSFISSGLDWTIAKNNPPWLKKGRRDRESSQHYEWTDQLGSTLGDIAGRLSADEVEKRFLRPIFELEGDACWALLSPFTSSFVCRYVYDERNVPKGAVEVIRLCIERLLQSSAFDHDSYYAGELHGFDQPRLVETLMFVSVEKAGGAARYVNGDWSEIGLILPLVDRYVRAAGWAGRVMSHFLTLCERAKSAYPAEIFADQILAVLGEGALALKGWSGTLIPARIAALVQFFADRDTPMPHMLGQKLLRILDLLVDMGDRRSAALQQSESFREIRIA